MVHECLEGAIEVGGGLGRGAKTHIGAEVVFALGASCAGVLAAGDTTLDGNTGTDLEVRRRVRPKGGDDASCFMA